MSTADGQHQEATFAQGPIPDTQVHGCCCARRGLNQERLCLDFGHEIHVTSMRYYGTGDPCAGLAERSLEEYFHKNLRRCDHAAGEASFEAETHN